MNITRIYFLECTEDEYAHQDEHPVIFENPNTIYVSDRDYTLEDHIRENALWFLVNLAATFQFHMNKMNNRFEFEFKRQWSDYMTAVFLEIRKCLPRTCFINIAALFITT